jgi:two-component system, cell cycle response regulator DivK
MSDYPAVLYIEDDLMSRKIMQFILKDQMQLSNVAIFEDSANIEVRLEDLPFCPDIVFLDIHIAPLTGFELLAYLRKQARYKACPIVALTASVMNEEIDKLKAAGFSGLISKPIDMDVLPELIKRLLAGEKIWRINKAS